MHSVVSWMIVRYQWLWCKLMICKVRTRSVFGVLHGHTINIVECVISWAAWTIRTSLSTKVHLIDAIVDVVELVGKLARLVVAIEAVILAIINRRIEAINLRVELGIKLPTVRVDNIKLVVVQNIVIQMIVVKVVIEQAVVRPAIIELTIVELAVVEMIAVQVVVVGLAVVELDSIKLAAVVQVIVSAETKSASQVITLEHSCVWYSWDSVALGIWYV